MNPNFKNLIPLHSSRRKSKKSDLKPTENLAGTNTDHLIQSELLNENWEGKFWGTTSASVQSS